MYELNQLQNFPIFLSETKSFGETSKDMICDAKYDVYQVNFLSLINLRADNPHRNKRKLAIKTTCLNV